MQKDLTAIATMRVPMHEGAARPIEDRLPEEVVQQVIISENPFDMLGSDSHVRTVVTRSQPVHAETHRDDDAFISILRRDREEQPKRKAKRSSGIFKQLRVLSKHELAIPPRKYYRFPYVTGIKNDESVLFVEIYKEVTIALSSVYSHYRNYREEFKVIYDDELICFGSELRATPGLERVLRQNGVEYTRGADSLLIAPEEAAVIYDLLINSGARKGATIPFILSAYEFEHAIVYHTRVDRGPVVSVGAKKEFLYTICGPLDASDFILEEDVDIAYVKD